MASFSKEASAAVVIPPLELSEYIYYVLTILFGAIAWVVGFVHEDFSLTVYGWSIGLGLSLILCIPDWPFFNRNPVQWLEKIKGAPKAPKTKAATKKE